MSQASDRRRRELLRQASHLAFGVPALLLGRLGALGGVVVALAGLVWNLLLWPRLGGRRLWRPDEPRRGWSVGMVAYPLVVLGLVLMWPERLEVAAGAWSLLAFGDGAAGVAGLCAGRHRLRWNRRKSWEGSVAYVAAGTVALVIAVSLAAPARYALVFLLPLALGIAVVAAALESWPIGLDDNVGPPLVAGLLLAVFLPTVGLWSWPPPSQLGAALAANLGLTVVAISVGGLDRLGAGAALVIGSLVWLGGGPAAYVALVVFFLLGTAAGMLPDRGRQDRHEVRSARHVVANGGVAGVCGVLALAEPSGAHWKLALVGALAAAAADTVGGEVGRRWGGRPRLVTTWRLVAPGTDGAVTWLGTVASVVAAAIVGLGWAGLSGAGAAAVGWLALAGLGGGLADSLLGATAERLGLLDNETVNGLATLVGAGIGASLGAG